jgi:Ca2+/Na+ antiporter
MLAIAIIIVGLQLVSILTLNVRSVKYLERMMLFAAILVLHNVVSLGFEIIVLQGHRPNSIAMWTVLMLYNAWMFFSYKSRAKQAKE